MLLIKKEEKMGRIEETRSVLFDNDIIAFIPEQYKPVFPVIPGSKYPTQI